MCSWCYASNCTGYVKIIGGFCKTIFSQLLNRNTRCYYHLKEKYLQFHSDLKCIRCAPLVWHGRCPGDTPNPAKPSQACFVWLSRLRCWCAVAILVLSLEVVGRKHYPWRNPTRRNHTLSSLVTGVARCRRCCLCPLHDQPIDLVGIHLRTPGPPHANVVGPRLVDKCTPVPPPPPIIYTPPCIISLKRPSSPKTADLLVKWCTGWRRADWHISNLNIAPARELVMVGGKENGRGEDAISYGQ